jgi:hypothetical protein
MLSLRNRHPPARYLHPAIRPTRTSISAISIIHPEGKIRAVVPKLARAAHPRVDFDGLKTLRDDKGLRDYEEAAFAADGAGEVVRAGVAASCADADVVIPVVVVDDPRVEAGLETGVCDKIACG